MILENSLDRLEKTFHKWAKEKIEYSDETKKQYDYFNENGALSIILTTSHNPVKRTISVFKNGNCILLLDVSNTHYKLIKTVLENNQ